MKKPPAIEQRALGTRRDVACAYSIMIAAKKLVIDLQVCRERQAESIAGPSPPRPCSSLKAMNDRDLAPAEDDEDQDRGLPLFWGLLVVVAVTVIAVLLFR